MGWGDMLKAGLALCAAVAICGCAASTLPAVLTPPEVAMKMDDEKCRGMGAEPGSQNYFDCRMTLDQQRTADKISYRRGLAGGIADAAASMNATVASNNANMVRFAPPPSMTGPAPQQPVRCITRPGIGDQMVTDCR